MLSKGPIPKQCCHTATRDAHIKDIRVCCAYGKMTVASILMAATANRSPYCQDCCRLAVQRGASSPKRLHWQDWFKFACNRASHVFVPLPSQMPEYFFFFLTSPCFPRITVSNACIHNAFSFVTFLLLFRKHKKMEGINIKATVNLKNKTKGKSGYKIIGFRQCKLKLE